MSPSISSPFLLDGALHLVPLLGCPPHVQGCHLSKLWGLNGSRTPNMHPHLPGARPDAASKICSPFSYLALFPEKNFTSGQGC